MSEKTSINLLYAQRTMHYGNQDNGFCSEFMQIGLGQSIYMRTDIFRGYIFVSERTIWFYHIPKAAKENVVGKMLEYLT